MVGDMVAQWWGALPPKPPGMSAANQAASVGIDFGCLEGYYPLGIDFGCLEGY